jgi:RNA polymerase sigma factor (sigma-70 family)
MRRIEWFSTHRAIIPRLIDIQAGAIAGLAGGVAMMVAGLLLSLASGQSIWLPLRCIAALVLGTAAMAETSFRLAPIAVGMAIHLLASGTFGIIFRLVYRRIAQPSLRCGVSICLGLAYGLLLWLIAFVCVVLWLDAALAEIDRLAFFLQHVVYGGVLGLICPSKADRVNEAWPVALRGPHRNEAIADLRAILVRRLRAMLADCVRGDIDALVEDVAQEALLQILHSLDTFRGESRFTTWAHTIAAHLARGELRRRRWRDVSLQHMLAPGDDRPGAALVLVTAGPAADHRPQHACVGQVTERPSARCYTAFTSTSAPPSLGLKLWDTMGVGQESERGYLTTRMRQSEGVGFRARRSVSKITEWHGVVCYKGSRDPHSRLATRRA